MTTKTKKPESMTAAQVVAELQAINAADDAKTAQSSPLDRLRIAANQYGETQSAAVKAHAEVTATAHATLATSKNGSYKEWCIAALATMPTFTEYQAAVKLLKEDANPFGGASKSAIDTASSYGGKFIKATTAERAAVLAAGDFQKALKALSPGNANNAANVKAREEAQAVRDAEKLAETIEAAQPQTPDEHIVAIMALVAHMEKTPMGKAYGIFAQAVTMAVNELHRANGEASEPARKAA